MRDLGELQPGFTPSGHTGELPSPVLPQLTLLTSGGQLERGSGHDSAVPMQMFAGASENSVCLQSAQPSVVKYCMGIFESRPEPLIDHLR